MQKTSRNQILTKIALAAVFMLTVGLIPNWEHQIKQLDKLQVLGKDVQKPVETAIAAPELAAVVPYPGLTAKSVLAYDFQSGSFLYTSNFDEKLPVASLTKLTSALVIVDSRKLDDTVEIQEIDTRVIGPNTGLIPGEKILVSELLKAMLIASHNDSTMALARYIGGTPENFVRLMNNKAAQLGLQNTHYFNPVGFDDPNHFSTALDIAKVLDAFTKNDLLDGIVKTKETEIRSKDGAFKHKVKTTNKLLLEDPSVIGIKTGYTTEAKGNLVVRSKSGKADVITIVLGSEDREGDTRKILDWISKVYRW